MYILNTPAHMYIVCTLSVKNVRDGGLFETDENDWLGGGHSILRRGSHGGQDILYVLFMHGE